MLLQHFILLLQGFIFGILFQIVHSFAPPTVPAHLYSPPFCSAQFLHAALVTTDYSLILLSFLRYSAVFLLHVFV